LKKNISSIWDNNFYESRPQPKWLFEVDFSSYFNNNDGVGFKIGTENFSEILNKAITEIDFPTREIETIKTNYIGIEAKFPGRVKNSGELNIKFNENENMDVTKILEESFHADASCDSYYEGVEGYSYNKQFLKTINHKIILKILKPNRYLAVNKEIEQDTVSTTITFVNCFLIKIEGDEFGYDSEDIFQRKAVFSYDYVKIGSTATAKSHVNDTCEINK